MNIQLRAEIYIPYPNPNGLKNRFDHLLFDELVNLFTKEGFSIKKEYITTDSDLNENPDCPVCCDVILIRNLNTNGVFSISFQDMPLITPKIAENGYLKGASFTHYSLEWIKNRMPEHRHLVNPGYYFPMFPDLVEEYRNKIKPNFEDKRIFFAGTTGGEENYTYTKMDGTPKREVVHILKEKYPDKVRLVTRDDKFEREEWWKEAAKHYINLSLPGHPWCNREFELWGLGLPVMAAQWKNLMMNNPIPNYHYLSVDSSDVDYTGVSKDAEYLADQFITYYDLIIDNKDFIKKIARQGKEFYDNHIQIENAAKDYFNLIMKSELI